MDEKLLELLKDWIKEVARDAVENHENSLHLNWDGGTGNAVEQGWKKIQDYAHDNNQ